MKGVHNRVSYSLLEQGRTYALAELQLSTRPYMRAVSGCAENHTTVLYSFIFFL